MKEFVMGENRIRFRDGLFFYLDGKGNRSLICEERAKEMEEQYYRYQASMDVDRGGVDPDIAYPGRGFSKCENGWWEYTRTSQTQLLAGEQAVCPIEGTFEIPGMMNDRENINRIASLSGSYAVKEGTVGIADCAFEGCKNLTHIELPNTLKYIGNSLFRDCAALMEIKIPRGVATMDIWTFYNCVNLEKLVIDNPQLEITWPAIVRCPKLTIYAARNSTAQKYARKYKISFQVQKRHIPVSLSCKVRKSNI